MMISPLDIAVTYFTLKYESLLGKDTVNIRRAKTLYSVVETLDNKYSERQYEASESGYGVLVRKQEQEKWQRKDGSKGYKICNILEKDTQNGLGMADSYYYYIIYRNKTLTGWADTLNLRKYSRKPGIYLPFSILKHIEDNGVKHLSELVIMLNMPGIEPRLLSIKSADLFKYFTSNKLPLLISAFGTYQTAVPIEILKELKKE